MNQNENNERVTITLPMTEYEARLKQMKAAGATIAQTHFIHYLHAVYKGEVDRSLAQRGTMSEDTWKKTVEIIASLESYHVATLLYECAKDYLQNPGNEIVEARLKSTMVAFAKASDPTLVPKPVASVEPIRKEDA